MKVLSDLEVLAALENLRLTKWNSTEDPDFILRVVTAVVAHGMGYSSRVDWTHDLKENGLVHYDVDVVEQAEKAKKMYEDLIGRHGNGNV